MEKIKRLFERVIEYFNNPSTVKDVENYIFGLIHIEQMDNLRTKPKKKFYVKLYDNPPPNQASYKVSSNEIGLESIRNIARKHNNVFDEGSESDKSLYVSYYSN
jgi:hypothetical protein